MTVVTHSPEETFAVGEKLAAGLRPGTFVLLRGDLGAGKTAFVKGLAAGLGVNPDDVTSPTFVLIQHYRGRLPLVHADLYRLETAAAVDDLGLEDLANGAVVAVEWAERWPLAPKPRVDVAISDLGADSRQLIIERVQA